MGRTPNRPPSVFTAKPQEEAEKSRVLRRVSCLKTLEKENCAETDAAIDAQKGFQGRRGGRHIAEHIVVISLKDGLQKHNEGEIGGKAAFTNTPWQKWGADDSETVLTDLVSLKTKR